MKTLLLTIGLLGTFVGMGVAQVVTTTEGNVNITSWDAFNCRRWISNPLNICSGNGICNSAGDCECNSGWGGVECNLDINSPAALYGGSVCTDPCQNGGRCYRPNGLADPTGELCDCTPEFRLPAGELGAAACSLPRVQLRCRPGDMTLLVYPQVSSIAGFDGSFGTRNNADSITTLQATSCLVTTASLALWNSRRFIFTYSTANDSSNPCLDGMEIIESTASDGTFTICYQTQLFYTPIERPFVLGDVPVNTFSPNDEVFRFCCGETATAGAAISVGTGTGTDSTGAQVDNFVEILASQIVYTDDKSRVATNVNVGERLSFVISFDDPVSTRYNDIRVLNCVTFPSQRLIVVDGCPNLSELSIIVDIEKNTTLQRAYVNIEAYRTEADANLNISCAVQVCTSACVNPTEPCLGTGVPNLGRKRREAGLPKADSAQETETVYVSKTVYVGIGGPISPAERKSSGHPDTKDFGPAGPASPAEPCDCAITSEVFIPVAVIFGALLVVVLTMAIFLCARSSARNRASKDSA